MLNCMYTALWFSTLAHGTATNTWNSREIIIQNDRMSDEFNISYYIYSHLNTSLTSFCITSYEV